MHWNRFVRSSCRPGADDLRLGSSGRNVYLQSAHLAVELRSAWHSRHFAAHHDTPEGCHEDASVNSSWCRGKFGRLEGQALIEFSLISFMLCILVLASLDIGRMVLVSNTVANAARVGVRYATVHGSTRAAGTGASNASGPAANPAQVLAVIRDFASAGLLTTSKLVISVNYPGASNAPGQLVDVTVVYPYDPLTTYFPLRVRLGSTTQGVIAF